MTLIGKSIFYLPKKLYTVETYVHLTKTKNSYTTLTAQNWPLYGTV